MIKKLLTVSIAFALTASSGLVYAQGSGGIGKAKAASCSGCHGEDGNTQMPGFPKLAGQHKGYLVKQLQAFKSGARMSPMMAPLALSLDDQAIEEVAGYFAANKIALTRLRFSLLVMRMIPPPKQMRRKKRSWKAWCRKAAICIVTVICRPQFQPV